MDHPRPKNKSRAGYFGNVKTRPGSELPAGVSRPPGFITGPWESASSAGQTQRRPAQPPGHVPFIRNPRLRQYYLTGIASLPESSAADSADGIRRNNSDDDPATRHDDTVFSVTSRFRDVPPDTGGRPPPTAWQQPLRVPESSTLTSGFPARASHTDPVLGRDPSAAAGCTAALISPSTESEYDQLLDVEAVPLPDGKLCLLALPPECTQGDGPASMQYLKLFCRFITDRKGVVTGILVVTKNKIFFDPFKSHPLVIENGCEEYLLSCTVDNLLSVSFYSDISHVQFSAAKQRWKGWKKSQKSKYGRNSAKASANTPPRPNGRAVPALVLSTTTDLRHCLGQGVPEAEEVGGESQDMAEMERQMVGSPLAELAVHPTVALGTVVLSGAATFCCGGQETEHREWKTQQQLRPKDKLSDSSRPSRLHEGMLMFVRFKHKRPPGKRKGMAALELGTQKTPPLKDSWFTMSQESSDELHAYLSRHRPDLCLTEGGEEEEGDRDEEDFVLVDDEEDNAQRDVRAGEDWELVSVEDGEGRAPSPVDKEPEGLQEILRQSLILETSHIRQLSGELPPRTVGHKWSLVYSTSRHGASLKTLYRKLSGSDSPVLIAIKDSNDQMFGCFLSHPLRPSDKFYGTGETFLFMLHPRFKCFRWTGENSFFIKGDLDSFAVGGGSGHFGLWLDETLYLGRSSPCYTFNNCCLAETDDFRVMELEVWTFH